jgi:DNA processing protein
MTPLDAAGLALLGLHDRRLIAALIRAFLRRADAADLEALVPRAPDESWLQWACRCRASQQPAAVWHAEFDRIRRDAERQLARAARHGVVPIALGDERYPALLAAIADPPLLLWVRGNPRALEGPAVALVGSRAATPHALATARRLALDLTAAGGVVVSGLARGIDSAAHAGAVAAEGSTVGVLGCGIDRIYPPEHAALAQRMEAAGAVVSEYPPGVAPLRHHFPRRNRIISGLSLAVVVIEAAEKSGALITASAAADQGRDVFVVPGPASGRNRGGHLLIRDGARLVESAHDLLQDLPALGGSRSTDRSVPDPGPWPHLTEFTVDEVAAATGDSPSAVLARLLDLELSGRIQRVGGGRFVRVLT